MKGNSIPFGGGFYTLFYVFSDLKRIHNLHEQVAHVDIHIFLTRSAFSSACYVINTPISSRFLTSSLILVIPLYFLLRHYPFCD